MFSAQQFIELARDFVCVRLDTYESAANQMVVREVLNGKLANTAFVIFAPDGKTQLCRSSRSPSMTFGDRGWRQDGGALKETVAALKKFVEKYPRQGAEAETLVPDFYSFKSALNVSSADQRLLVLTVAPADQRAELRESMQAVANDPQLRGKFHYDTAENDDAQWADEIENVTEKTGHFIIHADEFGMKGKAVARLPLDVSPERMGAVLAKANAQYASQEKPKHYREHLIKGKELGIAYQATMPLGLDKDRDGKLDRVRKGRKIPN